MRQQGKYDTSGLPEAQFEPGSRGSVLKNLRGITSKREMDIAEQAGMDRNYEPMEKIFSAVVRRTLRLHGKQQWG